MQRLPVPSPTVPATLTIDGARATHSGDAWSVTLQLSGLAEPAAAELLRRLLDACAQRSPGRLEWWVEPAAERYDRIAAAAGLTPDREIVQLRRSLPLDEQPAITTRSFRPGLDDEAWLEVNNRAFAWHEEQGGWTSEQLSARLDEPWFDPSGFLLHEVDGRLAGFCWTKVHDDVEPTLGEIFVIAVDPDFHGRGLGRELTLAGLARLTERGLTIGMLYVESDNEAANGLYRSLGFEVHQTRRRYSVLVGQ